MYYFRIILEREKWESKLHKMLANLGYIARSIVS